MPWKLVCDLWFHEIFTNNNLQNFLAHTLATLDTLTSSIWLKIALCMYLHIHIHYTPLPHTHTIIHNYNQHTWCSRYCRRKWIRRHEFKSWPRLITFHIALIPLGKVWIQLFSLQLWVNSRTDWVLQPWIGN